jgi:hypothetical protein
MYAINAAQQDAQQYPGQNVVIDEGSISNTVESSASSWFST